MYEVIVGNIGRIETESFQEANELFKEYVQQSRSSLGRAGGEDVTLFVEGEILMEHIGEYGNH